MKVPKKNASKNPNLITGFKILCYGSPVILLYLISNLIPEGAIDKNLSAALTWFGFIISVSLIVIATIYLFRAYANGESFTINGDTPERKNGDDILK